MTPQGHDRLARGVARIFIVVCAITGLISAHTTVINYRNRIAQERYQIEQEQKKLQDRAVAQTDLTRRSKDLEHILAYRPTSGSDVAAIIDEIEAAGERAGTTSVVVPEIEGGTSGNTAPENTELPTIEIVVVATGSPSAALRLMNSLENLPYASKVKTWTIVTKEEGTEALLTAQLSIQTQYTDAQ